MAVAKDSHYMYWHKQTNINLSHAGQDLQYINVADDINWLSEERMWIDGT